MNGLHWLDEHGDYLYRYARRRLMSDDLAQDAVQETLLAALEARASFAGRSAVRTWLTGILKHKVADLLRRHGRESAPPQREDGSDDWEALFATDGHWAQDLREWPTPESEFEKSRLLAALEECYKRLKPALARVLSLRVVEDMETEGICSELGMTQSHVWVSLHRARLTLRECLAGRL